MMEPSRGPPGEEGAARPALVAPPPGVPGAAPGVSEGPSAGRCPTNARSSDVLPAPRAPNTKHCSVERAASSPRCRFSTRRRVPRTSSWLPPGPLPPAMAAVPSGPPAPRYSRCAYVVRGSMSAPNLHLARKASSRCAAPYTPGTSSRDHGSPCHTGGGMVENMASSCCQLTRPSPSSSYAAKVRARNSAAVSDSSHTWSWGRLKLTLSSTSSLRVRVSL
mmetsp:Transcript_23341/g.59738  ORF Transcript_23341/g.59738 Transcript_23341/m.59738 type:complete len:220 (+) Transcript_23341:1524-2183(+)